MPLDNDTALATLRAQRDRFVGFAFAAADLLVETTRDGTIGFAVGAAQNLLGCPVDRLIGRNVAELIAAADRPIVASLLAALARGERIQPVALRLAIEQKPAVIFGGCRLGSKPDTLFLSLAVALAGAGADETMLSRADFAAEAAKVMLEPTSDDRKLTLVAVDELTELWERLGEETGRGLNDAIEHYLCSAGNVEAAGQLGDGRYGLIHTETIDTERLQTGVETLTRAIDPDGKGVSMRTATMALGGSGLDGPDAARALVYCINQFADSKDADLSLPSLRDGLDRAMAETIERVSALRSTVSDRDFTLVFQPIVHLAQRSVHHVEALARFRDGSPGETVAFAEAVRLIADFDLAVCEKVAAMLLAGKAGDLPIAVNISGRSLESELFCKALSALLRPELAKRLLIEITESAVISHLAEVNARVQAMRSSGFRVCLDDFGAGANSFHYLRGFEVDFVKIDGPFVKSALANPRDAKLIGAVAGYCREVGIATIGEMVEDEPAAQTLQKLGIDYAQGYHFGKPVAELTRVKLQEAPPEKAEPKRNLKRKGFVASWG